jgi:hypothetical protein
VILEQMLRKDEADEDYIDFKEGLTKDAHLIFNEIPLHVKNKQQESFTVLEVLLGF